MMVGTVYMKVMLGQVNKAYAFDGSDDYISYGNGGVKAKDY